MKTLIPRLTIANSNKHKELRNKLALLFLIAIIILFVPESFAEGEAAAQDTAFVTVYNKLSSWTKGTAGKLITLITLLFGAVGGVLGFNPRVVFGAIGVGLLLATSTSLVDILF